MPANPTTPSRRPDLEQRARRLHAVDAAEAHPSSAPPTGALADNAQRRPLSRRAATQRAYAEARHLGLFTGPTWTVLLITSPAAGGALVPFVVRARTPELAEVAAAAVIRIGGLHVLGVIPGRNLPLPGPPVRPGAHLVTSHPEAATAAAAVLDSHLAELTERVDTRHPEAPITEGRPAPAPASARPRATGAPVRPGSTSARAGGR